MIDYSTEPYFRAVHFVRRKLLLSSETRFNQLLKKSGRTMPSIIRPDEEVVFPSLSDSRTLLCFLIGLICIEERNDYAISKFLDYSLSQARRCQYNGKWSIWQNLIQYFSLSEEDNFNTDREFTIWSLPDFFDFLLDNMSEDDLFGNYLKYSISLMSNLRLKKTKTVLDPRPVKYPQRHRGYRDKGSCADFQKGWKSGESAARRQILTPKETLPKYSSLDQVLLFGDNS